MWSRINYLRAKFPMSGGTPDWRVPAFGDTVDLSSPPVPGYSYGIKKLVGATDASTGFCAYGPLNSQACP